MPHEMPALHVSEIKFTVKAWRPLLARPYKMTLLRIKPLKARLKILGGIVFSLNNMMCNVNTTDNKYTQTINNYWRNIAELSSKIWQDFDFTNRSFLLSTVITNYSF